MLAAPPVAQSTPVFDRSQPAFSAFPPHRPPQQQQKQEQYQQAGYSLSAAASFNAAAMNGYHYNGGGGGGGGNGNSMMHSNSNGSGAAGRSAYQPGSFSQGPSLGVGNVPMSSSSAGSGSNGMLPVASSSTQDGSAPSGSSTRRQRRPDTEEIKRVGRVHYLELFNYLKSHLAKGQRGPRTNAREKLTRLSQQQFTELSTDVYDELMRRINNARTGTEMPHLAVREEFHPKRNQARQKLATLPKNRFKDLSSDVFFELERRFPYLRDEFRPEVAERERRMEQEAVQGTNRSDEVRHNSALSSTLDPDGADETITHQQSDSSRSLAQVPNGGAAASTDVVVPAKSTMVEEQIALPFAQNGDNGKPWRASVEKQADKDSNRESIVTDADPNRSTMYSQASSIGTGFFNGYAASRATESVASPHMGGGEGFGGSSTFGIEKMRSDYEFRIATLQQKVSQLESKNAELNKGKSEETEELQRQLQEQKESHSTALSSLSKDVDTHRGQHEETRSRLTETLSQLDRLQSAHDTLRRQHEERSASEQNSSELKEDYATLQREYAEQEDVVADLRGEVTNLVEELRQLSLRNDEMLADKDSDQAVIRDLNNQVSSYKRKYENAKTELRNLKATSQLYVQAPKADDFMPASDEGVIADVSLTAFQSSIDELVAAARSKTPSNVLIAMKTVVLATTLITDDVAKYEQRDVVAADVREQLTAVKIRISNTLNNLMTACRNHASSHGLSPVSLLDAAASHVSTSIVDVVKLVKVRKATKAEAEEFEATFTQNGTLPNGLKPLHTNALNSSSISKDVPFSPGSSDFRRRGSEGKGDGSDNRLGPNSGSTTGEGRFSPRTRQGSTMGRYSPVTYRSDLARKSSNGTGSWKASNDNDPVRKMSISSNTSASLSTKNAPAVPHIDEAILKQNRSASTDVSSPARSPALGHSGDSSLESSSRSAGGNGSNGNQSVLVSLRASIAPPLPVGGEDPNEENWAELRNYIEVQTEAIVHSIQALLSSIREGAQGNQLHENLTQITTIVSSIIAISKDNIPKAISSRSVNGASPMSEADGERILGELSDNCEKLIEMQMVGNFDKTTKSNMASASYGVAKGLKALSGLLNGEDQ